MNGTPYPEDQFMPMKPFRRQRPNPTAPHKVRTVTCRHWRRGHCELGDSCLFLHGDDRMTMTFNNSMYSNAPNMDQIVNPSHCLCHLRHDTHQMPCESMPLMKTHGALNNRTDHFPMAYAYHSGPEPSYPNHVMEPDRCFAGCNCSCKTKSSNMNNICLSDQEVVYNEHASRVYSVRSDSPLYGQTVPFHSDSPNCSRSTSMQIDTRDQAALNLYRSDSPLRGDQNHQIRSEKVHDPADCLLRSESPQRSYASLGSRGVNVGPMFRPRTIALVQEPIYR